MNGRKGFLPGAGTVILIEVKEKGIYFALFFLLFVLGGRKLSMLKSLIIHKIQNWMFKLCIASLMPPGTGHITKIKKIDKALNWGDYENVEDQQVHLIWKDLYSIF